MNEPVQTRRAARGEGRPENASPEGCAPEEGRLVLVRFSGEVSTKSNRTRGRFQERLVENLRDACGSAPAEIDARWSRLFVRAGAGEPLPPLRRVFGISSYSEVEGTCPARLERIVECGRRLYADRVRGRTFAVRARRAGSHPFDSYDVQRELGAALNPGAEVDLDDPEVTVRVEVREDRAYLFSDRPRGAGGLPLGVQGRALALVSGGFDSAVAAWMTLRRGVELDYLFCNLGGAAYRRMVLEVMKPIADRWSYGTRPRLHVVEFGPVMEELRETVKESYWQVVLKRLMYRAGDRVADRIGAEALVTGESVGQVSSQTLSNLGAIDAVARRPVLRPLSGFDKEQIVERAREIGTYELSARVREYCAVVPGHPVTAATPDRAERHERGFDPEVLEAAVAEARVVDLREASPAEIASSHLFIDRVPEEARVLDVRPESEYRDWHWPGSERRELTELRDGYEQLDRERTYVLVCARGLQTAHLAEQMQAAGYEAYSFRGGTRALEEYAESAGAGRDAEGGSDG